MPTARPATSAGTSWCTSGRASRAGAAGARSARSCRASDPPTSARPARANGRLWPETFAPKRDPAPLRRVPAPSHNARHEPVSADAHPARRHRRHRRLQERRDRAPPARARCRGAGRDDGRRLPLRHAAHVPGAVRPAGAHGPLGRGRRGRDGPHRTGALGRPHPGRAGDGRLHRPSRARPGRRPAHDAVPRDRCAARGRAGHEPR